VNKDQILHIGELSEALQRLRQDVQRALDAEPRACPRCLRDRNRSPTSPRTSGPGILKAGNGPTEAC
jgi:hypothetical protein